MVSAALTITEVARRAGLRASAIRYYERIALLPAPARRHGRRRYDEGVLSRLAIITTAQQVGFTIAEVGTLLDGFDADTPAWTRWQVLAREKLPKVEVLIDRAQGVKRLLEESLTCECLTLDECMGLLQRSAG